MTTAISRRLWARILRRGRQHLDVLVVIDEAGDEVDSRPLPEDAPAPGVWNRGLMALGYVPIGPAWTLRNGMMTRPVEPAASAETWPAGEQQ